MIVDAIEKQNVSFVLLRQALKNAAQENADFDNLVIYVAKDCTSKSNNAIFNYFNITTNSKPLQFTLVTLKRNAVYQNLRPNLMYLGVKRILPKHQKLNRIGNL